MKKSYLAVFFSAGVVALSSLCSMAGEVTISNVFQPGTPAKSAEVNENFAEISEAINDNHERISALERKSLAVFVGGEIKGYVIAADIEIIRGITDEGYFFQAFYNGSLATDPNTFFSEEADISFSSPNCTGSAYYALNEDDLGKNTHYGLVLYSSNMDKTWYVPKNTDSMSVTVNSRISGNAECQNHTHTIVGYPIFDNIDTITGMPNGGFSSNIDILN